MIGAMVVAIAKSRCGSRCGLRWSVEVGMIWVRRMGRSGVGNMNGVGATWSTWGLDGNWAVVCRGPGNDVKGYGRDGWL